MAASPPKTCDVSKPTGVAASPPKTCDVFKLTLEELQDLSEYREASELDESPLCMHANSDVNGTVWSMRRGRVATSSNVLGALRPTATRGGNQRLASGEYLLSRMPRGACPWVLAGRADVKHRFAIHGICRGDTVHETNSESSVTVPGFWSGKHRSRLAHDGVRSTVGRRSPLAPVPFQGVLERVGSLSLQECCLETRHKLWFFLVGTISFQITQNLGPTRHVSEVLITLRHRPVMSLDSHEKCSFEFHLNLKGF